MAKVLGAVGEHAGRQSVEAFKRMFLTLLVVVMLVAFAEGVLLTFLIAFPAKPVWVVVPLVIAISLYFLSRHASNRVDEHETTRLNWRKGALGEYEVGAELERLSDQHSIFNNLNTQRFGNFDHIVVGPSGVFVVETKNWKGLIVADDDGELARNGKPLSQRHVHTLERKVMTLREQIVALTRQEDLFVRGLIVFPNAYVEAPFGKTRNIHCLTIERLRDYIDSRPLRFEPPDVDQLVRALNGIAGMDANFGQVKNTVAELATAQ